jgi:8-oxo-dGTP pyrophosphatase MutT (NUDIX family)
MSSARKQNPLLAGTTPLKLSDAVAAIILVDGKYLLQRRDPKPDIWYPGFWGLFGGGAEPGEDPVAALARELHEELELTVKVAPQFFTRFDFDLGGVGLPKYFRAFYIVPISAREYSRLTLHEGAEMRLFSGAEILSDLRVSPYDDFAIMLHHHRLRLTA